MSHYVVGYQAWDRHAARNYTQKVVDHPRMCSVYDILEDPGDESSFYPDSNLQTYTPVYYAQVLNPI